MIITKVAGNDITDYTKSATLRPTGQNVVGNATVQVVKAAGGLSYIKNMAPLEMYKWDGSNITRVFFGGFLAIRDTTHVGTSKVWNLDVQDYNVLLDTMWGRSEIAHEITIPIGTIYQQLTSLMNQLAPGAIAAGFDVTTHVDDLLAGGLLPFQSFLGKSFRYMLGKILTEIRRINPALRPAIHLGPSLTVPRATFGGPCIYLKNRAATPAVVATFDNTYPTPGGREPFLGPLSRKDDSTRQRQWRQAWVKAEPVYTIITAQDAGSIATYPNPWSRTGGWEAGPMVIDNLATADAQELLDYDVIKTRYPKEVINFPSEIPVLPGQYISLYHDLEGWSNEIKPVVEVTIDLTEPVTPTYELGVGARALRFGEAEGDDADSAPVEADLIPPRPPAAIAISDSGWDYNGTSWIEVEVEQSPSADVAFYRVYNNGVLVGDNLLLVGGFAYTIVTGRWNEWYAVKAVAVDSSGNESDPTGALSAQFPTPAPTAPSTPARNILGYNSPLGYLYSNRTQATIGLVWTPPGGTAPDDLELEWWSTAVPTQRYTRIVPNNATTAVVGLLDTGIQWNFRIRSRVGGYGGPWSATFQYTIPVEDVPEASNVVLDVNQYEPDRGLSRVEITWDAAVPSTGNPPITHYTALVRYGDGIVEEVTVLVTEARRAVFYLVAGMLFTAQIIAHSQTGNASSLAPASPPTWTAASAEVVVAIKNPDFEEADPLDWTVPANWKVEVGSGSSFALRHGSASYTGKWGVRLVKQLLADWAQVTSEPIAVRPGRKYELTAASMVTAVNPSFPALKARWFTRADVFISEQVFAVADTPSWAKSFYTLNAPGTAAILRIVLRTDDAYNGDAEGLFDSLSLREYISGDTIDDATIPSAKLVDVVTSGTTAFPSSITRNSKGQITAIAAGTAPPLTTIYIDQAQTNYTLGSDPTSDTTVKRDDGSTALSVSVVLAATKTVRFRVYLDMQKDPVSGGRTRFQVYDGGSVIYPSGGAQEFLGIPIIDNTQVAYIEFTRSLTSGTHTITVKGQAHYTTAAVTFKHRILIAEVIT